MKRLNLTGTRHGRLVVVASAPASGDPPRTMWLCRCDCGATAVVGTEPLRRGLTRSCGCFRAEVTRARSVTHDASRTPEHRAWLHAKGRCFTPTDAKYPAYGARGVTMCDEWRDSFEAFLRYVGPRPSPRHTIDRIDVNGHYEPGNVRWATPKEQGANTREAYRIALGGEIVPLIEVARRYGVSYKTLHKHVSRGDDPLTAAASLATGR